MTSRRARVVARRLASVLILAPVAGMGVSAQARASDASPPILGAPALPRERMGVDLGVGFGSAYGGLGAQVRFDVPVGRWFQVAPFVAFGYSPKDSPGALFSPAAGFALCLGHKHRLAVDLAVGPAAFQDLGLHGTVVDTRVIFGPVAAIGYELAADGGGGYRVTVGAALPEWPDGVSKPFFTLNIGVGVRVW